MTEGAPKNIRPSVYVGEVTRSVYPGSEQVYMPIAEVRTPSNEEVATLISNFRGVAQSRYIVDVNRYNMLDSDRRALQKEESEENSRRQRLADVYASVLEMLGQGEIVRAIRNEGTRNVYLAKQRSEGMI